MGSARSIMATGLELAVHDLVWETEPGWHSLAPSVPTLYMCLEEVGGRAELRTIPDTPAEGAYHGDGNLSFTTPDRPVFIHAREMRRATLAAMHVDPAVAEAIAPGSGAALRAAAPRLMFDDDRLRGCLTLLASEEAWTAAAPYRIGLARAVLGALVDAIAPPAIARKAGLLTGQSLNSVTSIILDRLDEPISMEELAEAAGLPVSQFSKAFSRATGLSPQRWKMDVRVRWAQRLMLDAPAGSLADVAELTGFADQSHFSRVFHQMIGVTPSAWIHERS